MTHRLIHNCRLVLPDRVREGCLVIEQDMITGVLDEAPTGFGRSDSLDLRGAILAPGLIDIHIHGSTGVDVQATDDSGLDKLGEFLASNCITGYFPTLVPSEDNSYISAIATLRRYTANNSSKSS